VAGFPFFSVDVAHAMLDWDSMMGDERAKYIAIRTARGIATDFPVTADDARFSGNKGAFWDCMEIPKGSNTKVMSNGAGERRHSVLSTARIADALLRLFQLTNILIFETSAINACNWLILKQTQEGYFIGDSVDADDGHVFADNRIYSGMEAMRPLVQAYAATRNEVYIKAAWKIHRHFIDGVLPRFDAPALFPGTDQLPFGCPVAIASAIVGCLDLDAQGASTKLRQTVGVLGSWLRMFPFDDLEAGGLNFDGMSGGVYQVIHVAERMFLLERNPQWLHLAYHLLCELSTEARSSWRIIPAFFDIMITLAGMVKSCRVSLPERTVMLEWRTYMPDSAATEYIRVEPADGSDDSCIDYLPLVSKQTGHVLVLVLSHANTDLVRIIDNEKQPVVKDVMSNELIDNCVALHPLPFPGPARAGIFIISP
jgi:hypothetical protein